MNYKKNYTKWFGACALISLLLSGCGNNTAASGSANAGGDKAQQSASGQQSGQNGQNGQGQGRAGMNPEARQMMGTFQALVAMDKADGLAITKDEAAKLLPIVQASITAGKLTSDDQGKLEGLLTADQKKYVDDDLAKMQQRMQNRGNGGNGGKGNWNGNGKNGGNGGNGNGNGGNGNGNGASGNGDNSGSSDGSGGNANAGGNNGGNGGGRQRGNGGGQGGQRQNIGEQLVQLLQSK